MKDQYRTSEKELSGTEISNLTDKVFKEIVIRLLIELRRRMDAISKNFNKDIENMKKNQSELKNTVTEIRNTQQIRGSDEVISTILGFHFL